MTHKELVRRAAHWLRYSKGCTIVMAELSTNARETPDCIGFHSSGGGSVLIECKVSRSDFLADRAKVFRKYAEQGMGDTRFFAVPKGLVIPEEMPEGWGLLEFGEKNVFSAKSPVHQEANKRAEVIMLVSSIRRLEIATAVFVQREEPL